MTKNTACARVAFSLLSAFWASTALAQEAEPNFDPDDYRAVDDPYQDARSALAQQESDVDESEHLEQVLSASDRRYSLVPRGEVDMFYMFNYDYVSTDLLDIELDEETGRFTRFDVERDAEHSIRNTITLDYGVLDNFSLGIAIPMVTKINTSDSENATMLGDLSLRARWQPWHVRPGEATYTFFGDVTLPTGRSPYEVDVQDDELSSGSGFWGVSTGFTVSKVVDPVVAFGSFSVGYNFKADDLDQNRGGGRGLLREVDPGESFSFGIGMAYALSYDVSLTLQYQQSYSSRSDFVFENETVSSTSQNAGIFSVSTGWRLSPDVIMNVSVGVGQTGEAPDIVLGVSLPITYGF